MPKDLIIIESTDTLEQLITQYKRFRKTISGKTIKDISLIWEKLTDWISIEEAEFIMPFQFSKQRNRAKGYRIWFLSQTKGQYYMGNWFDLKVSQKKRKMRKQCKLSKAAIEFFRGNYENLN